MSAITKVNTTNGRKNPIPKREPVAAYESMLGPSFSPSMTRHPGHARGKRRPQHALVRGHGLALRNRILPSVRRVDLCYGAHRARDDRQASLGYASRSCRIDL